jgi:hypothetical protein
MERFTKLFGTWLLFIYHCFDRMVLSGYLLGLQRPGQVVYWLRTVKGIPAITKQVLSERTARYVGWVESYARNQRIPLQWAEKGVNKEEYVRPYLRKMERANRYGVYFILQAKEQGWTYRPGYRMVLQSDGSEYPLLHKHRSRYRFYYFYIRDEVLGPMVMRMGTFVPFEASYYLNGHSYIAQELRRQGIGFRRDDNAFLAVDDVAKLQAVADGLSGEVIEKRLERWTFLLGPKFSEKDRRGAVLERSYYLHQVEYCRNFIFLRNRPIRELFERSCELGLWELTADKVVNIFGGQKRHRLNGKVQTTLERMDGRHVFRAYWKHAWLKQYAKFWTYLRDELTSNNLGDFGLLKGIAHLGEVRKKFLCILDRFAGVQAENLNVHGDFPLLTRIALPVVHGKVHIAGIRVQDPRMIRLLEVLLHAGTEVGGWTTRQLLDEIHQRFGLRLERYDLSSLRYDLRKLKAHGLLERVDGHYRWRLTNKGQRLAILFLLFHRRLCGPLAASQFHRRPDPQHQPKLSKLEAAYHKADQAIDEILNNLRAA